MPSASEPDRQLDHADLEGVVAFLRAAEQLKDVTRSGFTSGGRPEDVAAHSWRVALLAMLLAPHVPGIDTARLLRMCIVHDLGEAIGGDVPAPEQVRRQAAGEPPGKGEQERHDLLALVAPLPGTLREELVQLWDEYEAAQTPEARLAKAADKLETILQHVQGRNPADFDYRFNLQYGRAHTASPPLIASLRRMLDEATEARALEAADRTDSPSRSP